MRIKDDDIVSLTRASVAPKGAGALLIAKLDGLASAVVRFNWHADNGSQVSCLASLAMK